MGESQFHVNKWHKVFMNSGMPLFFYYYKLEGLFVGTNGESTQVTMEVMLLPRDAKIHLRNCLQRYGKEFRNEEYPIEKDGADDYETLLKSYENFSSRYTDAAGVQ